MSTRPATVLVIGATGSIGAHVVREALAQRYSVRALVRDESRAKRRLPDGVEAVVGDLTRPETLGAAVAGVDAIVFTHGSTTREADVRDVDYAGVANALTAMDGRPARLALMTAVGTTRPGAPYAAWKRRAERLVRASGNDYTIVRPGWFDYNDADQRRIVMRQGDTAQSGTPADGVIARDEIARVLVDSLRTDAANRKTLELAAEHGPEQADLTEDFAALQVISADPAQIVAEAGGGARPPAARCSCLPLRPARRADRVGGSASGESDVLKPGLDRAARIGHASRAAGEP